MERHRRLLRGPWQVGKRGASLREGSEPRRACGHVLLPRGLPQPRAAHHQPPGGQPAADGHRQQVHHRRAVRAGRAGVPALRGREDGGRHVRAPEPVGPRGAARPAAEFPADRGAAGQVRPAPARQEQEDRGRAAVPQGEPTPGGGKAAGADGARHARRCPEEPRPGQEVVPVGRHGSRKAQDEDTRCDHGYPGHGHHGPDRAVAHHRRPEHRRRPRA
mmetsp:Transcript_9361/g.26337  ORF Transcript_9361/g.26337 Transcript_9361/m.26337 type:complete len:218 (+) Transcript_9361:2391-3044(+)